jgi:hypothetical protein
MVSFVAATPHSGKVIILAGYLWVKGNENLNALEWKKRTTAIPEGRVVADIKITNFDDLVKSLGGHHPGESGGPKHAKITGFRLSPE